MGSDRPCITAAVLADSLNDDERTVTHVCRSHSADHQAKLTEIGERLLSIEFETRYATDVDQLHQEIVETSLLLIINSLTIAHTGQKRELLQMQVDGLGILAEKLSRKKSLISGQAAGAEDVADSGSL